jgi:transposase
MKEGFAALVALDWADERHIGYVQARGKDEWERFVLKQTPEAIKQWVGELRQRFKGEKIALVVEQRRGALIYALQKYEIFVIFPLNTTAAKNYRKALRASGAKDDVSDAEIQLTFLRNHIQIMRRLDPDTARTRQLRLLVEHRRKLVNRATALGNQLTAELKEYFPLALQCVSKIRSRMACEFLRSWPSLERLKKANEEEVRTFYFQRNCRSKNLIETRISAIRNAVPLVEEKPILQAYELMTLTAVRQIKAVLFCIKAVDKEIEKIFNSHPDAALFKSFPAAAAAMAPRLAVATGEDRTRFESAAALANFSGISPVSIESGKSKTIAFRLAAPKFQRQTFHEYAAMSLRQSLWANAVYQLQRQRGKSHHAALRVVAYKWIRIIYRCWINRQQYDERKYLEVLKKKNPDFYQKLKIA